MTTDETLEPFVIEWWPLVDGVAIWPDEVSDPVCGGVKISDGETICIFRGRAADEESFTMISGNVDDMGRLHAILGEAIRRVRANLAEDPQ